MKKVRRVERLGAARLTLPTADSFTRSHTTPPFPPPHLPYTPTLTIHHTSSPHPLFHLTYSTLIISPPFPSLFFLSETFVAEMVGRDDRFHKIDLCACSSPPPPLTLTGVPLWRRSQAAELPKPPPPTPTSSTFPLHLLLSSLFFLLSLLFSSLFLPSLFFLLLFSYLSTFLSSSRLPS